MLKDIIGLKFSSLTVLSQAESKHNLAYWNCLCDCGSFCTKSGRSLRSGKSSSCGCETAGKRSASITTHGKTNTKEHQTWLNMKARCNNVTHPLYKRYGAKGIKVCKRWDDSFENFLLDIGYAPTKDHSIDRFPDGKGNYEPTNCRWATIGEQSRNKADNIVIEYLGKKMVLMDWCILLNAKYSSIRKMIQRKPFHEIFMYYKAKEILNKKPT